MDGVETAVGPAGNATLKAEAIIPLVTVPELSAELTA